MAVNSSGTPRWRQLAEQLTSEIRAGGRPPGSRLPSVAEQAVAGISQTTTLRAYRELMASGLAVSVQGSGTYVVDPLPAATPAGATLEALEARVEALEQWRLEHRCGPDDHR